MQRLRLDPRRPPAASPEELAALDARTQAELAAAADADPDNPPLDERMLARMLPAVDVRRLRQRFGLSQRAFAQRYRLPLGTVRDWEQGRALPDRPARVLLAVIERSRRRCRGRWNIRRAGARLPRLACSTGSSAIIALGLDVEPRVDSHGTGGPISARGQAGATGSNRPEHLLKV
jgi:putative transcriptional regulator